MQNVTIKIDKLIGTLVIVGNDVPTEDIKSKVEEALLKVLKSASDVAIKLNQENQE